ncbi:MAG: diaminopimelate decarboxylase [Ruminococcaceae bacterium]|nr:diaminopimelate decarboxylase [Oscillospiraceae bacterium]
MLHQNLNTNEKGNLTICGYDTVDLAKEYGTPAYIMDEDLIRENCRIYKNALEKNFGKGSIPLYASKAFSCKRIYEIAKEEGIGCDVVSGGELYTVYKSGFDMEKVFFHGNNKTENNIEFAFDCKLGYFVVDNNEELEEINTRAQKRGITQKILLRITPGIDPHTHKAVVTGNVDSKFGSAIETGQATEIVKKALNSSNIELCGLHCHIGSQIFECDPFTDAAEIMIRFIKKLKDTLGYETKILNLGGGMGVRYIEEDPVISYEENIDKIAEKIISYAKANEIALPTILMEPGRSLVAASGLTLYTVGSVKEIPGFKKYVSIDGGMPDNPRYALYQSIYTCMIANKATEKADYVCTVAGRCCESGDLIAENTKLQSPKKGDTLAVLCTGAYNYSMASNYNKIPRPPVVMVSKNRKYVAVARETYEDLMRNDL